MIKVNMDSGLRQNDGREFPDGRLILRDGFRPAPASLGSDPGFIGV
jgi:hypothetical protein